MRTMLMAALLALGCGGEASNTQARTQCVYADVPGVGAAIPESDGGCTYFCRRGEFCEASHACLSLLADPQNCGACGRVCTVMGGQQTRCVDGMCVF